MKQVLSFDDTAIDRFFIDLVVYDPAPDGNQHHATPRALVEFKRSIRDVNNDAMRVRQLASLASKQHHRQVDGFVIVCGYPGNKQSQERDIGEAKRYCIANRMFETFCQFTEQLGTGKTFNGVTISITTEPPERLDNSTPG